MLCEPKHAHMRAHTHKPFDLHGNQEGFIYKEKKKNSISVGILFGDQSKQRTSRQSYYMFLLIKIQLCPAFQKLILQKSLCSTKKLP